MTKPLVKPMTKRISQNTAIPERTPCEWATHVAQLEQQGQILTAKVEWYESRRRLAAQRRFAASQERSDVQQLELFNEAETETTPALEPATETIERKKSRVNGTRNTRICR